MSLDTMVSPTFILFYLLKHTNVYDKQRSQADVSYRTRRARPPKLTQKQHDFSYNRSQNSSIPHAISFKQSNNRSAPSSIENDVSLVNSIYRPSSPESYFDQCFEVLERLGEGSFGEVFKVRSKEDGRLYAIKKSLKLYRSQVSRQERIEEVKRYEQFSGHENCITLHKAWEQNDLLYMQLELCKSNLEAYVMNRSDFLSEIEIWDILIDLLLAVKALHDQNLIHLDIKSENIMVSEDNVCKLGDFGLVTDLQKVNIPTHNNRVSHPFSHNLYNSIFSVEFQRCNGRGLSIHCTGNSTKQILEGGRYF